MDDQAYLAALAANPDDDAIRLVWADALQARGEPRGELIALQLAEARALAAGDLDAAELAADAADELLADHEDALTPPGLAARVRAGDVSFGRGVVEHITCTGSKLLGCADEVFATTPVLDLTFDGLDEAGARRLAAMPGLAQVRALDLTGVKAAGAAILLASPHLTGLRRLTMRLWSGPDIVGILLGSEALAGLTGLNIELPGDALHRLLSSTALPALRELDAHVDRHAVAALTAPHRRDRWTALRLASLGSLPDLLTAPLPSLRELALTGAAGPGALDRAELPALRRLRLSSPAIGLGEVAALLAAPAARNLEALDLRGVRLDDPAAATALAHHPIAGLRSLELAATQLEAAALRALLGWEPGGLERLSLERTRVGDDGARAIAEARGLGRLRLLSLDGASVTEAGVRGLAAADLPALRELRLHDARLDEPAVEALGAAPGLPRLRTLRLGGERLGGAIATALIATPLLARLVDLELSTTHLSDDVVVALAASPEAGRLRALRLGGSRHLTSAALLALARAPHLARLRELDADWFVDPDALAELVATSGLRRVRALGVAVPTDQWRTHQAVVKAAFGRRWRAW